MLINRVIGMEETKLLYFTVAFVMVLNYLESNEIETVTISELVTKMGNYLKDISSIAEPYVNKWMMEKLSEHYGDKLVIISHTTHTTVVSLQKYAANIITDFHSKTKQDNTVNEKLRIIENAAKLLKCDINNIKQNKDTYPTSHEMEKDEAVTFVPSSMRFFLHKLFVGKDIDTYVAFIGQSIMQRARPRGLLCPLQLDLGVQIKGRVQSCFLIDELSADGFSISNTIVQHYEKSAAVNVATDIPINNRTRGDLSIQYMAANFDHNVVTLDGRNTVHAVGMMLTVTPLIKHKTIIPRVKVSKSEIKNAGRVTITESFSSGPSFVYQTLHESSSTDADRCQINLLWKVSLVFKNPRPAWFGTMQGGHPIYTFPL